MSIEEIMKEQGYTEEQIAALTGKLKDEKLHVAAVDVTPEKKTSNSPEKNYRHPNFSAADNNKDKDAEIASLKATLQKERIEKALVAELTAAGAADVDYLLYKLEKSGELAKLTVTDEGVVGGYKEAVETLKTSHADKFAASGQKDVPEGAKQYDPKKLEAETGAKDDVPMTMAEAIKAHYEEELA